MIVCLGVIASSQVSPPVSPTTASSQPVNLNANRVTKKVYDYLWNLSYGSTPGVIVGQNAGHGNDYLSYPGFPGSYDIEIESLFKKTGKYPGMLGVDYEFREINSIETLKSVNISLAAYWNAGGLITINYSPRNILTDNILYETAHAQDSRSDIRSVGQMNKILPGGSLRDAWLARLDVIASALQDLQNKGVTVLWRPIQEGNGDMFWYATSVPGKPGQSPKDYIAV